MRRHIGGEHTDLAIFNLTRRTGILTSGARMRAFTSRSDDAQSSSVVSIDAPVIHGLLAMETY